MQDMRLRQCVDADQDWTQLLALQTHNTSS